jgi:hypothetical protein
MNDNSKIRKIIKTTLNEFIAENYIKKIPIDIYDDIFNTIKNEIKDKSRIIVFGSLTNKSVSKDNENVIGIGDIDICYNLNDYEKLKDIDNNYKSDCRLLLKLAKKHYGYLDNFILLKNNLLVRDDNADSYMYARNEKQMIKSILSGIKFSEGNF